MTDANTRRRTFPRLLPSDRLGTSHGTLPAFFAAVHPSASAPSIPPPPRAGRKIYSLVVTTSTPTSRILLGRKHRGFGTGLLNAFGGKLDPRELPAVGAARELKEEANVAVPVEVMERASVGMLHFTFDQPKEMEMVVHLFRVDLVDLADVAADLEKRPLVTAAVDLFQIKGCEEITPEWFSAMDIPFDSMFADDSIWMPILLSADRHVKFDGWFHFDAAVEDLNCLHYHLAMKEEKEVTLVPMTPAVKPFGLEKRLFHQLHDNMIHSPSIKEFKEAWSFAKAVIGHYGRHFDVVIDVAGGHGALAALLLILSSAKEGVVVDPAVVGGRSGVRRAWGEFYQHQELRYRDECLRTGLPAELDLALGKTAQTRVLVVACHACQHLSEEAVEIALGRGVHVAVMPCCQKDRTGGAWKALGKQIGLDIGPLMDLLLAGRATSAACGRAAGVAYSVKVKVIDAKITPQNRLIMCKAKLDQDRSGDDAARDASHGKLERAYVRAHRNKETTPKKKVYWDSKAASICTISALVGLCAGMVISRMATSHKSR